MEESDYDLYGRMYVALDLLESCGEFAKMIPEVRTNLVYARKNPKGPGDVLAVDGRITVVSGMPRSTGRIRFGASSHMARLIVEVNRRDPSIRAGVDFANTPHLAEWLASYCESKGWVFSVIDRAMEPEDVKIKEEGSMPWKVGEAIRATGGRVPKIFYETGAVGKEPVSVLVGEDPVQVVKEACEIARLYAGSDNPTYR